MKNTIFTPDTVIGAAYYVIMMGFLAFSCCGCGAAKAEPDDATSDKPTFTMESPAPYPVLNAITDNPQPDFADERESLKIMEYGAAGTSRDAFGHYTTEMVLEAGRQYSLVVHVHNDADGELGDDAIAENVQFTLSYPTVIDGDASLSVLLTADNTTPKIVGSSINLHTDEELRIEFIDKTGELFPVKQYNYAMKDSYKIAVVALTDHGTGTITGNVGSLMPGYEPDSGAYIFLWFRVETAAD